MAERTREEHLAWCKARALERLDAGDVTEARNSMLSDLGKHPGTENHVGGRLGAMMLLGGFLSTEREVREWIMGFR